MCRVGWVDGNVRFSRREPPFVLPILAPMAFTHKSIHWRFFLLLFISFFSFVKNNRNKMFFQLEDHFWSTIRDTHTQTLTDVLFILPSNNCCFSTGSTVSSSFHFSNESHTKRWFVANLVYYIPLLWGGFSGHQLSHEASTTHFFDKWRQHKNIWWNQHSNANSLNKISQLEIVDQMTAGRLGRERPSVDWKSWCSTEKNMNWTLEQNQARQEKTSR